MCKDLIVSRVHHFDYALASFSPEVIEVDAWYRGIRSPVDYVYLVSERRPRPCSPGKCGQLGDFVRKLFRCGITCCKSMIAVHYNKDQTHEDRAKDG